jgi:hypothetical protein
VNDLQLYAGYVWAREKGSGPCPIVRARRAKNDTSYYLGSDIRGKAGQINLIAKHQNLGGLLHELAHALGHKDKLTHGPAFRQRCARMYREYGDWDGQVNWEKQ